MMEIKEKYRIIWKNGFEKNDKKLWLIIINIFTLYSHFLILNMI